MRRTIRALLLLPLFLTVQALLAGAALAAAQAGKVEQAEGGVALRRAGTTLTVRQADPVLAGDILATGADGRAVVRFADETLLVLGQSSQAKIDDYVYDGPRSRLLFKLGKGAFRAVTGKIVQQNPQGFALQTPLATIGVRGSDVFALVSPAAEDIGALDLGAGHTLEVQSQGGKADMGQGGLFSRVTADGLVTAPLPIPPALRAAIARSLSTPLAAPVLSPEAGPGGTTGGSGGGTTGADTSGPRVTTVPQVPVITPSITPPPAHTPHSFRPSMR